MVLDGAAAYGADFAPFNEDSCEVVAGFIDCWNWEGDAFLGEKFDGDPIAGVGPFGLDAAAVSGFDVLALPLFEDGIVEDVFDLRLADVQAEFEPCVSVDGDGVGGGGEAGDFDGCWVVLRAHRGHVDFGAGRFWSAEI